MNNSENPQQEYSKRYRWYVLAMLTGVSTFAFLDRQLIIILQESIKADLGLTDTEQGLVTGFAFAAAFVIFGIPVAHLADRFNRKNIISITLAIWSAVTAVTGFVTSYFTLFLARVGVGIGETGSAPPAFSMIADYFPKEERARAYAVRGMGVYFGLLLGFLIGGLVEEAYGWRTAFFVVGTPGILFAILLFFTVKEPERGRLDEQKKVEEKAPSIKEVVSFLLKKQVAIYMTLGSALHVLVGAAFVNWMPPFLARVHKMGTAEIGIWLALAIGVFGAIGTIIGGYLSDKFRKKDIRWYLWIPAISFIASFPFAMGILFHPNKIVALLFYLVPNVFYAFFIGPAYALVQDLVTPRMRATASAVFTIILTIFGGGMGPFLAGAISDYLNPTYGKESIRYALFMIGFLETGACYFYWKAAKVLKKEDLL